MIELTEEAQRRTFELTEQGQCANRFAAAVGQLGSGSPAVQLSAVYAFGRPGRRCPSREFAQTRIDVLVPPPDAGVLPMSPDDTPRPVDGAYIVRQSWQGNMPILVALGAVDVFLLYQTIRDPDPGLVVALAAFGAVTVLFAVLGVRSVRRREVLFAVDSRGVYFGPTGSGARPVLIPWSWIACIVTFDLIVRTGGGQKGRRHRVGVELNAIGVSARGGSLPRPPDAPPLTEEQREFSKAALAPWLSHGLAEPSLVARQVEGWRLDMESLAQAVMRYAPDKPIECRPTRQQPGITGLASTAWQVHQNLRRRREH